MKKRIGFISNSSSSSFVVGFPRIPKDEKDLHDMMFPMGAENITPYDETMTSKEICSIVFSEMQTKFPNDLFRINEAGAPEGENEYFFRDFQKDHINLFWYYFKYEDDEGDRGCIMEHGDIFKNLKGYRINEH